MSQRERSTSRVVVAALLTSCASAPPSEATRSSSPASSATATAEASTRRPALQCAFGDSEDCATRCKGGEAHACMQLGRMVKRGFGVPEDPAVAHALSMKACSMGSTDACADVVRCAVQGARLREVAKKHEGERFVLELMDIKLDLDFGTSPCLADGAQVEALREKVITAYRRECDEEKASSCIRAADALLERRVDRSVARTGPASGDDDSGRLRARGLALHEAACDRGEGAACLDLAIALPTPLTDADAMEAWVKRRRELEQRACTSAGGASCFAHGSALVTQGKEVEAVPLLRAACDADSASACWRLGELEREGRGTPKDARAALARFERACVGPGDVRVREACVEAAILQRATKGKVDAQVIGLWDRGCKLGHLWACEYMKEDRRAKDKWPSVRDDKAGFEIAFPEAPPRDVTDDGDDRWRLPFASGHGLLLVRFQTITPDKASSLDASFDAVAKLPSMRGELVRKKIVVGRRPGMEARYTLVSDRETETIRHVIVWTPRGRLQVVASSSDDAPLDATIDRFFASLIILEN